MGKETTCSSYGSSCSDLLLFSSVNGLPQVQVEGISEGHPPPKHHWVIIVMAFRIKDYGMKNE